MKMQRFDARDCDKGSFNWRMGLALDEIASDDLEIHAVVVFWEVSVDILRHEPPSRLEHQMIARVHDCWAQNVHIKIVRPSFLVLDHLERHPALVLAPSRLELHLLKACNLELRVP